MPNRDELITQSFEQTLAGKKKFEELDNEVMASTAAILKAAAQVATKSPEEFFGLRPTERDKYFVEQVILPAIKAEVGAVGEKDDVVGGMGFSDLIGKLTGALSGLIPGAEIADKLIDLIKSEKDYWLKGEEQTGTRVR